MDTSPDEPTGCPSHEEIVIYVDGPVELDEARHIEIREHLKVCDLCRYKVAWCMGID